MTTTQRKIATLMAIALVPALVVAFSTQALANPRFGNIEFQIHLQQDLGMYDADKGDRPCPTVRGVPLVPSWGREWQPNNDWVRFVVRNGHPPGQKWPSAETPDQKWAKVVRRYRAHLLSQPYDGTERWHREHQHLLQYLEQNYYNYWYRLRYGQNPPNHDSQYHGWGYGQEGW